jgi:hypothetical protein
MAVQVSDAVANALLDQFESTVGTSAVLKIFTGSPPANCAAANSGTELASLTLPSDWLAAAASRSKAKSGTWSGTASGTGTAGHFRLYASNGTTCHLQGTVTATGGGGDMTVSNTSFASGQPFTVNTFTLNFGQA